MDAKIKLDLINKLSASLLNSAKSNETTLADKYHGAWEDCKSADELADEIEH